MSKSCLFFIVTTIFFSCNSFGADLYADYAKQWAHRFIYFRNGELRINKQELQAIRDLITISAHRSATTLKAQQEAFDMVVYHWQVWQNIAQTRLNPSHERPFNVGLLDAGAQERFSAIVQEQEAACKTYAKIAQDVVHGDVLSSNVAKGAVSAMRSQARVFMVDALTDVKKQLGELYTTAFKKTQTIDDVILEGDDQVFRGCSIADFILAYVPNLAMHTFVHADKTHNVLSHEAWQMLEKIQSIGNQVWRAIEQARHAYYQALLAELK